ncbi:hypothetical protein MES5069_710008 [Mesorhizobium escarrei]|uniref:Uncharacterized protein n=1 Tax=Mesorhizobium escarrei TaxID=666018 RepID=A0ABM9EHH3_9HYPH|nr:hypothetical protein MES5069_710008 [Mesorhizobium escarrei]
MNAKLTENTQLHRFELPIADGVIAAAYHRIDDRRIVLIHTEVPMEFRSGIAAIGARDVRGAPQDRPRQS